jgi:trans-2-enoyl-CoA reductase
MIEGVYNIRPPLPAVGGNEGVAVVAETGSKVKSVRKGDWVIPSQPGFGTWRTHAVCNELDIDRISNDIPAEDAATVSVNPCTAWRMLHDFQKLQPGDVIIQNGANSGVGLYVIQLAKHLQLRSINIMRDRPNFQEASERLRSLGADLVVSEEVAASVAMKKLMEDKGLGRPKLGLNCVGGDSSLEITRMLSDNSPMVTYGGMSRKPVQVPTGRLIFNNISLHGFWLSKWTQVHSREERQAMIQSLADLIRAKKLTSNIEKWKFSDFMAALKRAREGYRDKKVVLTMD